MTNDQGGLTRLPITAGAVEEVLVASAGVSPELFEGNESTPLEDLGLDSLAVLELEAVMSDRYGVRIPEGALYMSVKTIVEQLGQGAEAVS
jgi:acyl carrier protein